VQPGEEPELNPDGTPKRPPRPQTLREQAISAFQDGRDALGLKLLHAHFAVVPDAKQELAKKMTWIPALARPALVPRIGIAVQYIESVPKDFRGSPMPIGSPELTQAIDQWQQSEAGDSRIGGNRRSSKFGAGSSRSSANLSEGAKGDAMRSAAGPVQLSFYTGQFGEMFLDAIEERFETGEYGAAVQDVFREASQGRRQARGNNNQPGGQGFGGQAFGGQSFGGGFPGDGGFDPQNGGRQGAGARSALDGVYEGEKGRRWTSRTAAQEAQMVEQIKQISPCVLWLGKEDEREPIMKLAEMAGVDVLAIFEMTVREARTGDFVKTETRLRLLTTKANKPVPGYSPELLVNTTVEQWRQKEEKGLDPVEREVTKIIEALDTVLRPTPLPEALTAERAKKRIDDLVAEKPADPLPTIVEARFYAAKGLIKEQDFTNAAVTLLGKNGFAQLQAKAKVGSE
jgi:hypothetical protein